MRLNNNDIKAIKEVTNAVFGETATIRLFGSRTDDKKKGGDIDLLIEYNQTISRMEQYQLKIKFLVQLKKIIDDQKIDVIIINLQQNNSIFHEAYKLPCVHKSITFCFTTIQIRFKFLKPYLFRKTS